MSSVDLRQLSAIHELRNSDNTNLSYQITSQYQDLAKRRGERSLVFYMFQPRIWWRVGRRLCLGLRDTSPSWAISRILAVSRSCRSSITPSPLTHPSRSDPPLATLSRCVSFFLGGEISFFSPTPKILFRSYWTRGATTLTTMLLHFMAC